jgi:hypothetical protein
MAGVPAQEIIGLPEVVKTVFSHSLLKCAAERRIFEWSLWR